MTTTCTVTIGATGAKCGKPAVATFGTHGEYGECAEHHIPLVPTGTPAVGETVVVTKYGKAYTATVTKVTKTGTAYATFTTAKGTVKTVKV